MYKKDHAIKVLFVVLAVTVLAVVDSACSPAVSTPGRISKEINITINEDEFLPSRVSLTFTGHNIWNDLLLDVERVELHNGFLRLIGTHHQLVGVSTPGSVDLSLGAQDGRLVAQVIAVDIPGITLQDPRFIAINRELKKELLHLMDAYDAGVYFKEVTVNEHVLKMKMQMDLQF